MKLTWIYFITIAILMTSCDTNNETSTESAPESETSAKEIQLQPVEAKYVCMVNDQFMGGKEQILIEAEGKKYYGCCDNCIDKIKNNVNNVRSAKDPLTGEQVDKASAFIVKEADDDLLYFASEANYKQFLEQNQ